MLVNYVWPPGPTAKSSLGIKSHGSLAVQSTDSLRLSSMDLRGLPCSQAQQIIFVNSSLTEFSHLTAQCREMPETH